MAEKERDRSPAVLILPYFGKFGPWFPLFLRSLSQQRTLDLLLLTDATTPPLPENVQLIEMTLATARALAEEKLKLKVSLYDVRKLCDLRPFFGKVFEDFIHDYRYWAFGDEDVLYGDLDRLLAPRLRNGPDLIVPGKGMVIGHLTLLKNTPLINDLFMRDADHQRVLSDPAHWAYDERSGAHSESGGSFTEAVKSAEEAGLIKVDWGLPKRGDIPWPGRFITYDGKCLYDTFGLEIAYYHWGRLRGRGWKFPAAEEAAGGFAIDSIGFHDSQPSRLVRRTRQALSYGFAAAYFLRSFSAGSFRRSRRWVNVFSGRYRKFRRPAKIG